MSIFTGAGVAIVTPMKENGEVNFEKLGEILEEQIAGHTDAIIKMCIRDREKAIPASVEAFAIFSLAIGSSAPFS